jgi:hypothetical protein
VNRVKTGLGAIVAGPACLGKNSSGKIQKSGSFTPHGIKESRKTLRKFSAVFSNAWTQFVRRLRHFHFAWSPFLGEEAEKRAPPIVISSLLYKNM